MAGRPIKPGVKLALEMGPIAIFFAGYLLLRDREFAIGGAVYDGFIVMTAAFIPIMILSTALLWRLTGTLSRMQVATLVLVIVFGGLSVWLNDERFFKMKPTAIYLLFAGILGIGLWRGQSYLQFVMEEALPLQPAGWMLLTRRLTVFFLALAVANEAIWRTMSTDAWVNFKTFGLSLALFGFFMAQGGLLERYGRKDAGD